MIRKEILWRVYLALTLTGLMGGAIFFQSLRIQLGQGEYWRSMADSLTTSYRSIDPERGNIKSADDRLLATSLPFFEIRFDPNSDALSADLFYRNVGKLAGKMSAWFGDMSREEYKRRLVSARKKGDRYLLVSRKVTYPELQEIKKWPLFSLGKYKGGLIVIQKEKRINPFKVLAHRTIGYVREGVKPVGLEGAYDSILEGTPGKRLMQRIAGGTWIPINDDNEIEPVKGCDVITTIDVNLQDIAENALHKALVKHSADHGCVILMEVHTGRIRAIANLGAGEGGYWESYNYAVGESNEPGSTFKLASMIALLEDGAVKVTDLVDLQRGKKKYYSEVIRDSEEHDFRKVPVKKAFEISSNVGISSLVTQHFSKKPEKFISYLRKMGLDRPTGIGISGEEPPFVKTQQHKGWSGVSLAFMSIGYEVKMTPLQMLAFYNAIPSGGKVIRPSLVSEIREQEFGKAVEIYEPEILVKKICSQGTLETVSLLLEGVVENGTGRYIKTDRYRIAGKTGTAQIADRKHGYQKIYQSSFVGYFPADKPIYSCIVVINSPKSGVYYGSVVAAPVFREIADKVFASATQMHQAVNGSIMLPKPELPYPKAGFAPDITRMLDDLGIAYRQEARGGWIASSKEGEVIVLKDRKVVKGLVPDVTGMGLKDAVYLLGNAGLKVKVQGYGRVRSQSIQVGTRVTPGETITIELG